METLAAVIHDGPGNPVTNIEVIRLRPLNLDGMPFDIQLIPTTNPRH